MAVLSKDDFFAHVNEIVGNDTSDKSLQFLEDMTDTYADLESRGTGDGVDWEQRYRENDKMWAEKYRHRFFSGGGNAPAGAADEAEEEEVTPETIKIDDLFGSN